jgi:hypothetical protein
MILAGLLGCSSYTLKMKPLEILKAFITRFQNLHNHKVKIIRCDNGTEFKNSALGSKFLILTRKWNDIYGITLVICKANTQVLKPSLL